MEELIEQARLNNLQRQKNLEAIRRVSFTLHEAKDRGEEEDASKRSRAQAEHVQVQPRLSYWLLNKEHVSMLILSIIENRAIITFWMSVLVGSIGVLLYEFLRGNGWTRSVEKYANTWVGYYKIKDKQGYDDTYIKRFVCKQGEELIYYDDNAPNLTDSHQTRVTFTVVLVVSITAIVTAITLHFRYSLKLRNPCGSVNFVLQQSLWSKTTTRRKQDLATFILLLLLSIGAVTVGYVKLHQLSHVNLETVSVLDINSKNVSYYNDSAVFNNSYYFYFDDSYSSSTSSVALNRVRLLFLYSSECLLAWLAIFNVLSISTVVSQRLVDGLPAEDVMLPIIFRPSEVLVESILSISMIPKQVLPFVKSLVDENDVNFVHLDRRLVQALTVDQLLLLKTIWSQNSGSPSLSLSSEHKSAEQLTNTYDEAYLQNGKSEQDDMEQLSVIRAEEEEHKDESRGSLSEPMKQNPFIFVVSLLRIPGLDRVTHLLWSTREYLLFWLAFFAFIEEAAALWALPPAKNVDCFAIAEARSETILATFYTLGALCFVTTMTLRMVIVYKQTAQFPYKSLSYLYHLEYTKKNPVNRAIAILSLVFVGLCTVILLSLVGSNSFVYPVSLARLTLTYLVSASAALNSFFQTTFIGWQHLQSIPHVTVPIKYWSSSEKVIDRLMSFAVLSEDELNHVGSATRQAFAAKQAEYDSCKNWLAKVCLQLKHAYERKIDPNALYEPFALGILPKDLIAIKHHLWGEYHGNYADFKLDPKHAYAELYVHHAQALREGSKKIGIMLHQLVSWVLTGLVGGRDAATKEREVSESKIEDV